MLRKRSVLCLAQHFSDNGGIEDPLAWHFMLDFCVKEPRALISGHIYVYPPDWGLPEPEPEPAMFAALAEIAEKVHKAQLLPKGECSVALVALLDEIERKWN